MRDRLAMEDLVTRIVNLAETLVQTRYTHRCSDGLMSCIAVDAKTVAELATALNELREMEDV